MGNDSLPCSKANPAICKQRETDALLMRNNECESPTGEERPSGQQVSLKETNLAAITDSAVFKAME